LYNEPRPEVAAPFTFPYKALIPFHVVMLAMTARLWQPAIAPRPPASGLPEGETASAGYKL
jgi:hypothetical protein